MTPESLTQWIAIAQSLAGLDVNLYTQLRGILHTAHPSLTDQQISDAYDALIADDLVCAAIAAREAGNPPPTPPAPAASETASTKAAPSAAPPLGSGSASS
jgi:hypothetical protein